jgi:hypothetical protein
VDKVEDEVTEIQLTKIFAELDMLKMIYNGIMDNLDYMEENPEEEDGEGTEEDEDTIPGL